MGRSHYSTTLTFPAGGIDHEIDVTVSFEVSPGCAAQTYGPAERCYPAEDPEVTDITLVKIGDRLRPWGLHNWSDSHFEALAVEMLFASETHLERMLEIAAEDAVEVEDRLSERRWEERREMGL